MLNRVEASMNKPSIFVNLPLMELSQPWQKPVAHFFFRARVLAAGAQARRVCRGASLALIVCAGRRIRGIEFNMGVVSAASPFAAFERQKYLSLESFRRNGQGVRTPVWFAGDSPGPAAQTFYVYSEAQAGKAKRIRNNPRVRIAPCSASGKLRGEWVEARAEIITGAEAERGVHLLNRKYFPWKQVLDFFARFRRRGHIVLAIHPA